MPDYICNKNADDKGRHEVHVTTCSYRPSSSNSIAIGWCTDCHQAIRNMKEQNPHHEFDGCYYCCGNCHKG